MSAPHHRRLPSRTPRVTLLVAAVLAALLNTAHADERDRATDASWDTAAALLDTMNQSLAQQIVGDDHHSHQRRVLGLARGAVAITAQNTRHGHGASALCSGTSSREDWVQLRCSGFRTQDRKPACDGEQRCLVVQLAAFVADDAALRDRLARDLARPCDASPDAQRLRERHGVDDPQGPASVNAPAVARHWLFCDTGQPVRAAWRALPKGDGSYVVTWTRTAGR